MELKRCPFCGSVASLHDAMIQCTNEECAVAWCSITDEDQEIVDLWNARPLEDALSAEIAALRAEVERLRKADEGAVTVEGAAWNVSGRWILPL